MVFSSFNNRINNDNVNAEFYIIEKKNRIYIEKKKLIFSAVKNRIKKRPDFCNIKSKIIKNDFFSIKDRIKKILNFSALKTE